MQNTSTAVMQRRAERGETLDDFPTQPWATRALLEHVIIPQYGSEGRRHIAGRRVWEPSANRGHMVKPLQEYFRIVHSSDIFDYSEQSPVVCQDRVIDFLWSGSESPQIAKQGVDWIITNPPFRLAEQFIERSAQIALDGYAVIVRTSFLEGVGRWQRLFSLNPPTIVAQFSERVPMVQGRLTETGSTATSYCWMVWIKNCQPQPMMWIPPCRRQLERSGDYG